MADVTRALKGQETVVMYGEINGSTEIAFDPTAENATFFRNARSFEESQSPSDLDVTTFGDYPDMKQIAGAMTTSFSAEFQVKVKAGGAYADDLEFIESHCLTRKPFRIAILENGHDSAPNGMLYTVEASSRTSPASVDGARTKNYSLVLSDYNSENLPSKMRIVAGEPTPIEIWNGTTGSPASPA